MIRESQTCIANGVVEVASTAVSLISVATFPDVAKWKDAVRSILPGLGCRLPGVLEECLDVVASKTFDSSDGVTGQLASAHHAVDCHRSQLQQVGQLPDSVELRLIVFPRSYSLHLVFLIVAVPQDAAR
jgi:hypothetical protein